MPIPPENLAMVGSDWPGADWNREKSTRLVGPRWGEELRAQLDAPHGVLNAVLLPHVIRFNAEVSPERFVPLAAASGIRTEGVLACLATNPRAADARDAEALFGAAL